MSKMIFHNSVKGGSLVSGRLVDKLLLKNDEDFFKKVSKFCKKYKNCLIGGYFAYDLVYQIYGFDKSAVDDLGLPDVYLCAYEDWEEISGLSFEVSGEGGVSKEFTVEMGREFYEGAYSKIKEYILAGDFYQINLTQRLKGYSELSSQELFARLVRDNEAEHMAYIEGEGFDVLSASPERFIRIEDGLVKAAPVKGTVARGAGIDDELACEKLLSSEKEAAELNMITDLLRNDLGMVSEVGSVVVRKQRELLKCSKVWHTYSEIEGRLRSDLSEIEALMTMLPGGSISGCPKKRACEVIDELELVCRGVYTGCVGYILPGGRLDFNIAIRTIVRKGNDLYLNVGGGIVMDSEGVAEYSECFKKAESLTSIL